MLWETREIAVSSTYCSVNEPMEKKDTEELGALILGAVLPPAHVMFFREIETSFVV